MNTIPLCHNLTFIPHAFFNSDVVHDLIDSLGSNINFWYLDGGNLSDDYRTVMKNLKKTVQAEKTLGLKIEPMKCEIVSLMASLINDKRHF